MQLPLLIIAGTQKEAQQFAEEKGYKNPVKAIGVDDIFKQEGLRIRGVVEYLIVPTPDQEQFIGQLLEMSRLYLESQE